MRTKYITPKDIIPNYPKNSSPVVLWRDITSTPLSDKERIISDIVTACYTFISERQTTNLKIALQNAKKNEHVFDKIHTDEFIYDPHLCANVKITIVFLDNKNTIQIRYRVKENSKYSYCVTTSKRKNCPHCYKSILKLLIQLEDDYKTL